MLTAIIIDDESSSRHTLQKKIADYCSGITIIGECENAAEGIRMIEEKHPDIVFLDVQMPRMNGFTMLHQLKNRNFEIIFTTAYDHYAIQAIRVSALDYLVKPIEVDELKIAVEKAKEKRRRLTINPGIETLLHNFLDQTQIQRIAIPSMEGLQFVEINDIIYLEAISNYTVIYLQSSPKLTISKTLKDFEELLPGQLFLRIHHSHLINKKHIQKYIKGDGGQVLMSNGQLLDVARRKKEEFMKAIGH